MYEIILTFVENLVNYNTDHYITLLYDISGTEDWKVCKEDSIKNKFTFQKIEEIKKNIERYDEIINFKIERIVA